MSDSSDETYKRFEAQIADGESGNIAQALWTLCELSNDWAREFFHLLESVTTKG